MVQWGGAADPEMTKKWDTRSADDPVRTTQRRGTLTFAASSLPNSRTTHMFVNFVDNSRLDDGILAHRQSGQRHGEVDQIYRATASGRTRLGSGRKGTPTS